MFRAGPSACVSTTDQQTSACRTAPCGNMPPADRMQVRRPGPEIGTGFSLLLLCDISIAKRLDTLDSGNRAHKPAADAIGPVVFEADGGVPGIQRKQEDLLMHPGAVRRIDLSAVILFQGVTIAADVTLVLHQNNTILPRADYIGMKKAPGCIADPRFHGTTPAARCKHAFCSGNSLWDQSHSWLFQFFPVYITDTDKLAASDSKAFDCHLAAGLGCPQPLISEASHH